MHGDQPSVFSALACIEEAKIVRFGSGLCVLAE
jgi:hypothetical protein